MLHDLYSANAFTQYVSGLLEVVALHETQNYNLTLIIFQGTERSLDLFLSISSHQSRIHIVVSGQLGRFEGIVNSNSRLLTVMVDQTGMSNLVQPRQYRQIAILVAADAFHETHEHFRRQILGDFG